MIDQEIMEKVQAIRDKTGEYAAFSVEGDAYVSGDNALLYTFHTPSKRQKQFNSREALIAHLDGILEGL